MNNTQIKYRWEENIVPTLNVLVQTNRYAM